MSPPLAQRVTNPQGTAGDSKRYRGAQFGRMSQHLRDPFPAVSHWVGALLAVAGMAALLQQPLAGAGKAAVVVYGLSLVGLFATSAYAHSTMASERHSQRMVIFDYSAIFLLIAGTYTPVTIIGLGGKTGLAILIAEWVLAACGIWLVVFGLRGKKCPTLLRVGLYVLMGWLGFVAPGRVIEALGWDGLGWLVAGGLVYTLGAVVFVTDRPRLWPGKFVAHDLWHVMVIVGAACHYVAVWRLVAK